MNDVGRLLGSAVLATVVGAALGCGHSVKPNAPYDKPEEIPAPRSLSASQEQGAVILSWEVDGDVFNFVEGWNIYRRDASVKAKTTDRINDAIVTDVSYRDETVSPERTYAYSVRAVTAAGVESLPEGELLVRYDLVAPAPVEGLVAEADRSAVLLTWDRSPAADLYVYRLYRDDMQVADGLADEEYRDAPLDPSREYRYNVTAVDGNGNESAPSAAAVATPLPPLDVTAPPAPEGLSAEIVEGAVSLSWNGAAADDLLGYVLYRGVDGPPADRIPPSGFLSMESYEDADATLAAVYSYAVTAVDSSGNESGAGDTVSVNLLPEFVNTGGHDLSSVYPWCGIFFDSGEIQFLIPAADIGRPGAIGEIALWVQSGDGVFTGVTVTVAQTDAAELENVFAQNLSTAGDATVVFGPGELDSSVRGGSNIMPIALDTPFPYDGESNLLVAIEWTGDDGNTLVTGYGASGGAALRLYKQPAGMANGELGAFQQFVRIGFND